MDVLEDLKLLLQPIDVTRIIFLKSNVYKTVKRLKVSFSPSKEPVPFEARGDGQRPVRRGRSWGGLFGCAWFRVTGEIPQEYVGKNMCVAVDFFGEALAYSADGTPLRGISHVFNIGGVAEYFNPPIGKSVVAVPSDGKVDLWFDCGFNGAFGKEIFCGRLRRADLVYLDESAYRFYFDYLAAAFLKVVLKGGRRRELAAAMNKAYFLYVGGKRDAASAVIQAMLNRPSDSDLTVTAVGHSHLDLAWLWPLRETERKAARTVSTALANLKKYPQYVYGASQPQEFEWLKNKYPSLYEKVLLAAKEGRFEPQGGMWVECDTNLTGGESLIRQFVYGLRFWETEFGVEVNNCWLPDVFGYTAALPQIIKGCGLKYFMTQKISWNEHNEFPLQTFRWQGTSDDEVLVHLLPANTYNSSGAAPSLAELYRNHKKKDKVSGEALMLFGAGDGGGGPCEANIELISRYRDTYGLPKVNFGKAGDFFRRLDAKRADYPSYKGELYLEKHQGTYTTQSNNKKSNRKCEYALHTLEALGALAESKGFSYPRAAVDGVWKEILLYQFHDVLPGSSITRVYAETDEAYGKLTGRIAELTRDVTEHLSEGKEQCFFNPAPFERDEYLQRDGKLYRYHAEAYGFGVPHETETPKSIAVSENSIENDVLKAVFAPDGSIASLIDKNTGKEFNKGFLNRLNVYYDKKLMYNAWDIDINYTKRKPRTFRAVSSRSYIDGASAVMETEYVYGSSNLVQRTVLTDGCPYVEFDTSVDWHETHRMLRAEFMPSVYSDKVVCDIQFGNIARSTRTDNKKDWAQFEICAHKYVDVSDGDYGCAVMSDCKYGYRVKDGLISLNLLRSPVYPDRTADRGRHRFRYAFCPHTGDCFEAEVPKHSYLFNIVPVEAAGCDGNVPLLKVSAGNVVAETLKPADDGGGFVVRLYENEGKAVKAAVETTLPYKRVYLADMRERKLSESSGETDFKPYEIKTLYFER